MSMGHNDRRQRELSAKLEDAVSAFLRSGGRVYIARPGESGLDVVALQSPKGKARTHKMREAAK